MHNRRIAYVLALFLGLAYTAWLFPRRLLFPVNYYDMAAVDDTADHIIGQRYFLLDRWEWPPLRAHLLRWPRGTNIALTDSIPLLAIPGKIVKRILPPGFHSIFWFLAVAWCLQPVAAVYALRSTGEKRLLPSLSVAFIALSMPTLFYRSVMGHEALCGHFLVLVAIGTYFRILRGSRVAMWAGPPALLIAGLLVHPYLMAMVAAVLVAAPISCLVRRERLCLQASAALLTAIAISGGLALLLGYTEEAGGGWGYGYYSMNLLAPVYPAGSTLIPFFPTLIDATGGQYEGYQYLGVGALMLCLVALICVCIRVPKRVCARHSGLIVTCAGLTVFALSNYVYNNTFLVFHIENVPQILQSFRSSGRFFWPVAYLLILGSIAMVTRRLPTKVSAAILLIAASLQFADTTALRNKFRDHLRKPERWYIDRERLGPLMERSARLTVWPRYECRGNVVWDPQYLQVLLLASRYGLRTNTAYTANPRPRGSCRAADIVGAPLQAGELRIILSGDAVEGILPPNSRELCRQIGHLTACSPPS